MRAAVEHAHGHGLAVAFDVMLKDRAAIRLYEAAGSQRIGTLNRQHGDGWSERAAVYVVPNLDDRLWAWEIELQASHVTASRSAVR